VAWVLWLAVAASGQVFVAAPTGTAIDFPNVVRFTATPVPKPASLALTGLGLAGAVIGATRGRRRVPS
jgi:hypothetical protein